MPMLFMLPHIYTLLFLSLFAPRRSALILQFPGSGE